MAEDYFDDLNFVKIDYTTQPLDKGTYEGCHFEHCLFTKADLSAIQFTDCRFQDCDISLANLKGTSMRDVQFNNCKMMGLHFEECNNFLFSVGFDNCILNHSSFYNVVMKKTIIKNCSCKEADFSGADLSGAILDKTDLLLTRFDHTNLEKADFRTSFNYSFDPEINKVKKAKFSIDGIAGLLDKYGIEVS